MVVMIGINGFGRIGRLVLRAALDNPNVVVVGINDPFMDVNCMKYLLEYDSVHGRLNKPCSILGGDLIINNMVVHVYSEKEPRLIPWGKINAAYICECSGVFTSEIQCNEHIIAGAKKVVLSAAPEDDMPMFVMGVNHATYDNSMKIVSNSSSTTNCLAPLAKIINDEYGISEGLMTTIRSMNGKQSTVDGLSKGGKDWRSGRCASQNIVPALTGAAKAVGQVVPELAGRLNGLALRVPTANVSVVDLTCRLSSNIDYSSIVNTVKKAAEGPMKGIITWTEDEVVSSDFIHNKHSCIFDVNAGIALNQSFMKLICWYDNEWAYSNRMVDLIMYMESRKC